MGARSGKERTEPDTDSVRVLTAAIRKMSGRVLHECNRLAGTQDRIEGIEAFNEKREPKFIGR